MIFRTNAVSPHMLYTNRRGLAQGCTFWGAHRHTPNHGSNPSKTPQSGQQLTFPALIFLYFRTRTTYGAEQIIAQNVHHDETHNVQSLTLGVGSFQGSNWQQNRFEGEIPAKLEAFIS
jgi:hypothetical protein